MPQLTILMPAFNAASYVAEAIKSLLLQSFSDFELWIIDDASTDETYSIIKSFQDTRIKLINNEINQGRVRTINKLVKEIQSLYFTVTDAEDVSHPRRFEKQVELLERDHTLMMRGTSFWAMDEQGFLVRKMSLLQDINALRKAALEQSQFLEPTTVMRKELINTFPHFYREYFIDQYADADLSCLILDNYASTNVVDLLYFYRIVKASVTRKKITVRNLNLHLLVGFLCKQRRGSGQDCLQRNAPEEADEFLSLVQSVYDLENSNFYRHQAFFHLYWGLNDLAWDNMRKAILKMPFLVKNWFSLFYIIFRIAWFNLNRSLNKVHYSKYMNAV